MSAAAMSNSPPSSVQANVNLNSSVRRRSVSSGDDPDEFVSPQTRPVPFSPELRRSRASRDVRRTVGSPSVADRNEETDYQEHSGVSSPVIGPVGEQTTSRRLSIYPTRNKLAGRPLPTSSSSDSVDLFDDCITPTVEQVHCLDPEPEGEAEDEDCLTPTSDITVFYSTETSGHAAALQPTTLTPRFTCKWPKIRHFEQQHVYRSVTGSPSTAPPLEEGQGLRPDHLSKNWTSHKGWLFGSILIVFAYGFALLLFAVTTWLNTYESSGAMVVADYDILIIITLSASILVFTSLIGVTGILLHSRPVLAVYALLLWPALLSLLAIGYISYKRATFSLDRKLNFSWSRFYTTQGKQIIQDTLQCCGFYNPRHDPAPSRTCYLRSPLPGCRGALFRYERRNLRAIWRSAFVVAGVHLANIIVALLCANHITKTFGKGIMPRQYWLTSEDIKVGMNKDIHITGSGLYTEEKARQNE